MIIGITTAIDAFRISFKRSFLFLSAMIFLLPKKMKLLVLGLLVLIVLLLNQSYWHAKDFLIKEVPTALPINHITSSFKSLGYSPLISYFRKIVLEISIFKYYVI